MSFFNTYFSISQVLALEAVISKKYMDNGCSFVIVNISPKLTKPTGVDIHGFINNEGGPKSVVIFNSALCYDFSSGNYKFRRYGELKINA
ncbi:hypothetical protein GC194_14335 [bacterium]|nr:hypothetical protein [bacterium]